MVFDVLLLLCVCVYVDIMLISDFYSLFSVNLEHFLPGRIKNTEPLSWENAPNHILTVVAYDCGMKRSKPATVNIKVNRVCRIGWKGKKKNMFSLLSPHYRPANYMRRSCENWDPDSFYMSTEYSTLYFLP